MLNYSYMNGTLTITREDGYIVVLHYNPETLEPFASEAQAISYSQSTKLYFVNPNPEIIVNPTALDNKNRARQLLFESDWVTLIDVTGTTTFPYLANQEEYLTYRAALRVIVVNPIAGDMIFPVKPTSVWVEGVI